MINSFFSTIIFIAFLSFNNLNKTDFNNNFTRVSVVKNDKNNDTLKRVFKRDISKFLNAFENEDFDSALDMMYPKFFDLITKEQFEKKIKGVINNGMDIKTNFKRIEKISSPINYENEVFCRVYYNINIKVNLSGSMLEGKERLKQDFVNHYGIKNVKYKKHKRAFYIKAKKSILAISGKGTGIWKYLEFNKENEGIQIKIIPESVLKELSN